MTSYFKKLLTLFLFLSTGVPVFSQSAKYSHADSLKGGISKSRSWCDVLHYDLYADFNITDSSIKGCNKITYRVIEPYTRMQIDLMQPMLIDSVVQSGKRCFAMRDGNAFFVSLPEEKKTGQIKTVDVYFHGKPRVAKLPPWDGGVIWSKDKKGNPWVSIACQGMAAQVWFPNKDHMYDEADSCTVHITCPKSLITVSNGRRLATHTNTNETATYTWKVVNPINNYNIIPYIGKYQEYTDTLKGEKGTLDLSFWVLEDNLQKAKKQMLQAKSMLHCFEHWFGPYPFYEDGYKLVEAPFLGMEHQSAIAYGNDFQNGYRGRDLSLTGWGLKWDFIIVHESGHEWFGNNISAKDVADNWIHESFTAYSENLYTEWLFGKQAGAEYVIGTRKAVTNDKPIISDYNVNAGGSIDLYYKGANMLHNIRQIVDNDSIWREALRSLNRVFWHQTVSTKQIEDYLINFLKLDLQKTFDQYLRSTQIPVLEYSIKKDKLSYRWTNCVKGFNMPLRINTNTGSVWLKPTEKWQSQSYNESNLKADFNFYISVKEVVK